MKKIFLIKSLEPVNGVSKATGNEFSLVNLILEWQDENGTFNYVKASAPADLCTDLSVGDEVEADLRFCTNSFNGKVYNTARVNNIININKKGVDNEEEFSF